MKIRRLTLISTLLFGVIATAATAMTTGYVQPLLDATQAPVVADADLSVDGTREVAEILPSAVGAALVEDKGKVTDCGDGFPVASPPNGITGQGSGPLQVPAMDDAIEDATSKCIAYSGIKCAECPIPGDCLPNVSLLDSEWVFDAFQNPAGTWFCTATYKGPFIAYCSPCGGE